MIKVGAFKCWKENSKGKKVSVEFNYNDVRFDEDGWADAKEFMPADFELCLLKIKDKKTKSGWASALKWDGLNIEDKDQVLYWKKNKEYGV